MNCEQFIEVARAAAWSRNRTRSELYKLNQPELWARRDEVLASLGFATTAETAAAKQAAQKEAALRRSAIEDQEAAKRAEAAKTARLREQAEREQREAAEAELAAYREAERRELADVEPHWPTYRQVLHLAGQCRELADAKRYRDWNDVAYLQVAPQQLGEIVELVNLDDRSVAADVLRKTRGAMSESQAKLVALVLAKLAAKNGMTGGAPLSPNTAHRQEAAAEEIEEIVVALPRESVQRAAARFTATKKTGKPYLAKLGAGFSREFAKRQKFTNTTYSFDAEDLRIGDVLEFRGYTWSRDENAYEGGVEYAVIGAGAIYFVSRRAAAAVIDGANVLVVDRFTPVLRLTPDADVPVELPNREGCDFQAWLTDKSGDPIDVHWPAEEDE